jgi:thymidylate synthase (FAD)
MRPNSEYLDGVIGKQFPILDHGFVRVVDYMGTDTSIVQAARVSYGDGTKTVSDDEALVRYLMRHRHTTPFQMCEIKFHLKMPIFVARQWVRHRMFTINEYSARYSVVPEEYYVPEVSDICVQSSVNKQGRAEPLGHEDAQAFRNQVNKSAKESYFEYEAAIADGVARELARIGLPLNFYTEFYWKGDLHNLFHFLSLRCDHHAQYEIRVYANQILEIVRGWVPFAAKAFEDYRMNAVTLSAAEVSVLKAMLKDEELDFSGMSKRESSEFREKWW